MRHLQVSVLILLVLSSCKKDKEEILYGYECFPMQEGHYVIYDVVDIFHDVLLSPAHDTNWYQIKEVIGEQEVDEQGEVYRKLYRYKRLSDTLAWTMKDVWTIKRTNRTAQTLEENKRRINLAFSISYDQYWDYNALNEDQKLDAYYDNIYLPLSIGDLSFDSTVCVELEDVLTFIEYRRKYDIYATNVGKIYSVRKDLRITDFDTLNIQKGSEVFYTAIAFGVE